MRSRPILTPIAALLMVGASLWQAGGLPPATTHAQATGWVSRAPMPIARAAGAAVTGNDGRIYVFGGSNGAVNFSFADVSSPGIAVNALCVVAISPAPSDCTGAAISYGANGSPFTYLPTLAPGGGYQFNVKTTGLSINTTYELLSQAAGEPGSVSHGSPPAAIFTLTK